MVKSFKALEWISAKVDHRFCVRNPRKQKLRAVCTRKIETLRLQKALIAAGAACVFTLSASAYGEDGNSTTDAPSFEHVSCIGGENEIRVIVSDVKKSVGLIVADLYRNDEEGFLKRAGRVQQVRFAAKAPQTFFCMRAPSAESYAIALYHDENANKTLDKGAFGIPNEPWGISNNPKVRFGPPAVAETLFDVASEGAVVEVNLR